MPVHAHYDLDGSIRALVMSNAPPGAGMMLAVTPGMLVAEVHGLPIKKGVPDIERLRELMKEEKITISKPVWNYKSKRGRT